MTPSPEMRVGRVGSAGRFRAATHDVIVLAFATFWLSLFAVAHLEPRLLDVVNVAYFGIGFLTLWATFQTAMHAGLDRETARAWYVLGGAWSLIVVAGATWTAYLMVHPGAESPAWTYWVTASYQPMAVLAFVLVPGDRRITMRDRRVALDAALMAVGVLALAWFIMFRPLVHAPAGTGAVDWLSAVVGWLVVVAACAAYLRTSNPSMRVALALAVLAQLLFVLSDFVWGSRAKSYRPGDWVDALYFGSWLFRWAAARWVWHGASTPVGPETDDGRPYHSGIAPAAFLAGAYALLLSAVLGGLSGSIGESVGLAVVASLMTGLLVARQRVELDTAVRRARDVELQKERFRAVLDSATDYIFVIDSMRRVTWTSPSARAAFDVVSTASLPALVYPEDAAALLAWLPAGERSVERAPLLARLRRHDGAWEFLELRGRDLRDDPAVAGIVINGRSRTGEIEMEGRVRHAEKLATLHDMAGRIAHAFNNALTVVQGHAELLAADPSLDAAWHADLIDMRSAAGRGAAITRQLLGYSGRQVIQPEALDVAAVVGELLATWRRLLPSGTTVRLEGETGTLRALVDHAQFEQVMFNLVVNARDAMPDGGEIVISIGQGEAANRARRVVVSVRDTGVGMDATQQARIFEPFFTTKAPGVGTGLGLAMVDTIVQRARGEIAVTSAVGVGSTFTISLPAATVAPSATPAVVTGEVPDPAHAPSRATVMLVDDEDAVRNVSRRILARAGFDVLACGGGAEALEVAAANTIDVVVTDMMMPGMSGRELIERLVVTYPHLPIICITGFTAAVDARSPLPMQVQRIIEKPFDAADLIGAVRRAATPRPGQGTRT